MTKTTVKLILSIFIFLPVFSACNSKNQTESKEEAVKQLTTAEFKNKIFDFTTNKQWKYLGKKACIIDFYADWCGPCKRVAPIMDELSAQYKDIDFYKVNIDNENELANAFGIRSIPTIIFIPINNGQPQIKTGANSKVEYIDLIEKILVKQTK